MPTATRTTRKKNSRINDRKQSLRTCVLNLVHFYAILFKIRRNDQFNIYMSRTLVHHGKFYSKFYGKVGLLFLCYSDLVRG